MSNQPTPPPENEFLFDSIVQRDMSGVYKQFGGLGTSAGRKMYALYNKEESAAKRAQYRMELGEYHVWMNDHHILMLRALCHEADVSLIFTIKPENVHLCCDERSSYPCVIRSDEKAPRKSTRTAWCQNPPKVRGRKAEEVVCRGFASHQPCKSTHTSIHQVSRSTRQCNPLISPVSCFNVDVVSTLDCTCALYPAPSFTTTNQSTVAQRLSWILRGTIIYRVRMYIYGSLVSYNWYSLRTLHFLI